jgi:hypothetical protein
MQTCIKDPRKRNGNSTASAIDLPGFSVHGGEPEVSMITFGKKN